MRNQHKESRKMSTGNQLLAALPLEELERLLPNLVPVSVSSGETLCDTQSEMNYVYFPVDCIVALREIMEGGCSAEISQVGNEGIVGVSLFLGGESTVSVR